MAAQYWQSNVPGDWADPANWASNMVPGASDNVVISGASGVTITTAVSANSLELDGATISAITGMLTVTEGVTLNGGSLNLLGGTVAAGGIETGSGGGWINGYGTILGNLNANGGAISIDAYSSGSSGALTINGSITGSVNALIQYGTTLELFGAASANTTVSFGSNSGTLKLDDPAGFTGSISNVNVGNTIDLAGISSVASWTYQSGTLTINEPGGQQVIIRP